MSRQCIVCLESVSSAKTHPDWTPTCACRYDFHKKCFEEWMRLSGRCFICRIPISNKSNTARAANGPTGPTGPANSPRDPQTGIFGQYMLGILFVPLLVVYLSTGYFLLVSVRVLSFIQNSVDIVLGPWRICRWLFGMPFPHGFG